MDNKQDFIKKNFQQLHKPQCGFLLNMQQVTIQNNLNLAYMWFKSIDFNSKQLLGEKSTVEILFIFTVEKKQNN